ncbi:MAG: sigma-70 family RNA polymerase sigma factor [Myxococcota bacterium]
MAKRAPGPPTDDRPQENWTDEEAIAGAREGDHRAFKVLVQRYQGRAYGLALRILGDPDRARDAVQESFLKAYSALDRFEGRSAFYTWLYRLVFNQCIDMKRRDKTAGHLEWDDEVARQVVPSFEVGPGVSGLADPAHEVHRVQLREALAKAIESLPDDARRTLVMREVDGLSYAEIAKALEIPKGTVMSRLHHARRRVRKALIEAGVVEGEPEKSGDAA